MTYEHCTSIRQVANVLRNYDGRVFRDASGDGFWIDVDCQEFHGETRAQIIRVANDLFKQRNWSSAS